MHTFLSRLIFYVRLSGGAGEINVNSQKEDIFVSIFEAYTQNPKIVLRN